MLIGDFFGVVLVSSDCADGRPSRTLAANGTEGGPSAKWSGSTGILETPDQGSYQILLMSPEITLNNEYIRKYIHKMANKIACVVVDEAHCVAAWWIYDGCNSAVQNKSHMYIYIVAPRGEDLRPTYARICELQSLLSSDVRFLAMTATLETRMRDAVKRTLGMRNVHDIMRSANRRNIFYGMGRQPHWKTWLIGWVRGLQNYRVHYPKTIVFCRK